MPDTTRLALPFPEDTDAPDVPADMELLAQAIADRVVEFGQGMTADRPTAGTQGRLYWSTDDSLLFYDDGATWRQVIYEPVTDAAAGTGSLRTLGTGALQAAAGNDSRFTSGVAAESITLTELADALVPSRGAGTAAEAVRALGTGAGNACAGNDSRLSNQRVPTDGSVTAAKIASNAVTAVKIASNAVTAAKIAAGAVGAAEIAANAVGSSELAGNSVTGASIVDGSVTAAEIASGAVGTSEIDDGAVTPAKLSFSQLGALGGVTVSTADPSGGSDGDFWFKREA